MDKRNKIILFITIICTIVVVGICTLAIINHEKELKEQKTSDAIKFKEEYESLNGTVSASNNTFPTVTLPEESTLKYITEAEAVEILKNEKGVIYFGFNKCPWCRTMVTSLVNASKEYEVPLYYLDILDIRDNFEVVEGELKKTKEGTEAYYEILKLLDSKLEDYIIMDGEKKYETKEKRLYAPTVVAVDNGKIKKFHVGTVESQKSGFDILNEREQKELDKIFTEIVRSIATNSCSSTGC